MFHVTNLDDLGISHMDNATEPATVKTRPSWGYPVPADAVGPIWGARAIYTSNRLTESEVYTKRGTKRKNRPMVFSIDIPWDRQEIVGGTEDEKRAMLKWFDATGRKLLLASCDARFVTPDCDEVVMIAKDGYQLEASPRGSYGYLYISVRPL